MLDPEVCDRARVARDGRFDGLFVTGVQTTGTYCRPICPVSPAHSENVCFFPSAAAAEQAGFRPCLRCRPELAAGSAYPESRTLVAAGLALIEDGFLDEHRVSDLASRLGVSERQLTRLFGQQVGATPGAAARTRRVQAAKRLLDASSLSVTEIAFAAGFSSIRRFNAAFVEVYGRSPSEMRRTPLAAAPGAALTARLTYRPPLDWAAHLELRRADAIPRVERIEANRYRRTVRLGGQPGWLEVAPTPAGDSLMLTVWGAQPGNLRGIVERVHRMFDLGANPSRIAAQLADDPIAREAIGQASGLRLPGAWDGLEAAVWAIIAREVGPGAAASVMERLVTSQGEVVHATGDDQPDRLFPTPAALSGADLGSWGLRPQATDALQRLARAVDEGPLSFRATSFPTLVPALVELTDLDEASAQWVGLRALSEPDAAPFGTPYVPGLDSGSLHSAPGRHGDASSWRPWRSYVAVGLALAQARATHEGAA
jgi:AraC family transcriptional regulator of adaptative response / DNA-3-methyladenine glycosylase II